MDNQQLNYSSFFREAKNIVGNEFVLAGSHNIDRYSNSVSAERRRLAGVVLPNDAEQVQKLVIAANQHLVSLYPISMGKNWGLGSALPVKDDCVIVDLRRMNRIREVNSEHGYAVIEPGVTQRQLHDHLSNNNIPYILNVTGSAADTSILGNVLENGVGYHMLRYEQALGFEVVLGTGDIIKTGFGHFQNSEVTYVFKYGIGPSLDGLFLQSNFGIVTSLGIDLMPKQEYDCLVSFSIDREEKFPDLIELLTNLRKKNLLTSIIKIGNKFRSMNTIAPLVYKILMGNGSEKGDASGVRKRVENFFGKIYGPWNALAGLMGEIDQVRCTQKIIAREANKKNVKTRFVTGEKIRVWEKLSKVLQLIPSFRLLNAFLIASQSLYSISRGVPVDDTMPSLFWPMGYLPPNYKDPDRSSVGMISFLPIIPLDKENVIIAVNEVTQICKKYGFKPNITLSIINNKAIWSVIDVSFMRSDRVSTERAQKWIREITRRFIALGLIPQRVGIDMMSTLIDLNDSYWKIISKLKDVFDPNRIISPGRYNYL